MRHHLRLGRRQKRFAAAVGGQACDVVGAEPVQEAACIGAAQFELAAVRFVENGGMVAAALVFFENSAEARRHQPAGLFKKDRAGLRRGIV